MGRRRHKIIFAPREAAIQASILEHWLTLGEPNTLVAAVPNQFAHGQAGLTKGLPDLLVMGPGLPVAFVELKRDHSSPISDAQRGFGPLCARLGVPYVVAVGRDEPIEILEQWRIVKARIGGALGGAALQGVAQQGKDIAA